ncbi:hypothetical protein [Oribacterium sp. WCC10]|nr:hypothetical protein [Oribacterium sp. WCC10]
MEIFNSPIAMTFLGVAILVIIYSLWNQRKITKTLTLDSSLKSAS